MSSTALFRISTRTMRQAEDHTDTLVSEYSKPGEPLATVESALYGRQYEVGAVAGNAHMPILDPVLPSSDSCATIPKSTDSEELLLCAPLRKD